MSGVDGRRPARARAASLAHAGSDAAGRRVLRADRAGRGLVRHDDEFVIPTTGQPVRLRASGSLQVRCTDPGAADRAVRRAAVRSASTRASLRSVSRSVERMLARLLTRRVVMAATPVAVTDAGMLPGIIEELVAYNPTAGAVFGVELIRMGHLVDRRRRRLACRGRASTAAHGRNGAETPPMPMRPRSRPPCRCSRPCAARADDSKPPPSAARGERQRRGVGPRFRQEPTLDHGAGEPAARQVAASRRSRAVLARSRCRRTADEITQPGIDIIRTPVPGSMQAHAPRPRPAAPDEPRGAILGIGMSHDRLESPWRRLGRDPEQDLARRRACWCRARTA